MSGSSSLIAAALAESAAALDSLRKNETALAAIEKAGELLAATLVNPGGGRVYSCGNGGSMSDAMHFAEEFSGRYRENRRALAAQAISDVGHLSCVANDFGYEQVFSRYIEAHGTSADVLFAISTSGTSANVLRAVTAAHEKGMRVVGLTGRSGTPLATQSDIAICTPGGRYADRVQELHIKVIHILLEIVESALAMSAGRR